MQKRFKLHTEKLIEAIKEFGNPFEDDCPELLVLNTRDCADDSVIETVRTIEKLASAKYEQYKKQVIVDRTKSIHDTISKNSLSLFKSPKKKVKSKASQQLVVQRNNTSLFGRLYIANQQREGDPAIFFSHENQSSPPSLSDFGKIRLGQKSVLLSCLDISNQPPHPEFDSKVFDGAAVVHFLPTSTANTFAEYANRIFIPFLLQQLRDAQRVDCVWDRYLVSSIKDSTREHRGSGTRTKVSAQTKLPKKWGDFLRDSNATVPEGKVVFITSGRLMILMNVCMCYDISL